MTLATTDPSTLWTPGTTARLLTINAQNLYRHDTSDAIARYSRVEDLIRTLNPDVVAVQEIIADGDTTAAKRPAAGIKLRMLAEALRLSCLIDRQPAVAVGGRIHHAGLLWRPEIEPVSGSLRRLERDNAEMWHSAAIAVFDFGGPLVRIGSVHLSSFNQTRAVQDIAQLLHAYRGDLPGLLAGDFNCVGSDPHYDPDPYAGISWHPDHAYQLDANGHVLRDAATLLESPHHGRMRDCAVLAGTPWTPTTGHHPEDNHPFRRIDRWYATHDFPEQAVVDLEVADPKQVGDSTDHCPVILTIAPAALQR